MIVDGENVRRSKWPNVSRERLVELAEAWAREHGHDLVVAFDGDAPEGAVGSGAETADDWIVRHATELAARGDPYWLVTSDRALRQVAGADAERVIGGGAFVRELGA